MHSTWYSCLQKRIAFVCYYRQMLQGESDSGRIFYGLACLDQVISSILLANSDYSYHSTSVTLSRS